MTDHPEFDLLSAYIDGELDAVAFEATQAHLETCASCRATIDALRTTVAEVRLMEPVAMTEEEIEALDTHLAASRSTSSKPKWLWATGAVAASVVAVAIGVGVAHRGTPSGSTTALHAEFDSSGRSRQPIALEMSPANYSTASELAALINTAEAGYGSITAGSDTSAAGGQKNLGPEPAAASYPAVPRSATTGLDRCVAEVDSGSPRGVLPVRYEQARYKGTPAFLLFFHAPADKPTRIELWVMRVTDCYTLYFAQRAL